MKTIILTLVMALSATAIYAIETPFSQHFASKMHHPQHGPMKKMYGYVDVTINEQNKATITFKASNGRQLDGARFNARVKFLGDGKVVKSKKLSHKIGAAGFHGAVERKSSIQLQLTEEEVKEIEKVQVDFYLNEADNNKVVVPIYRDRDIRY